MKNTENLELELDDNTILSTLFGVNDSNLSIIEKINDVQIQYRGNKIKISGNKKSIFETRQTILDLFEKAKNGDNIDEDKIRDSKSLITMNIKESKQMDFFIQTKIFNGLKIFNFNIYIFSNMLCTCISRYTKYFTNF